MTIGQEVCKHIKAAQTYIDRGTTHYYYLRPNFAVQLRLPLDLSSGEAERLGDFLKAIPFQD